MTSLDKSLRRQLDVDGPAFTLLRGAHGLKLTGKGIRNGLALNGTDLVSGDAAIAAAQHASLQT